MCTKGTPSRIQSDQGDQLVAASKQIEKWDFEGVQRWAGKKGIEWHLQHFNGPADRMIGISKKQLQRDAKTKKSRHRLRGANGQRGTLLALKTSCL
jgi:hypothetical protein